MVRFKNLQLIALIILLLIACKKETDTPSNSNKIDFGATTIDTITYFSAQISTALLSAGGNQITQHGHCWRIAEQPTIEDHYTSLGSLPNPKTFISEIQDLEPNTTYYFRPYVTISNGTVYGRQQQIKTLKTGLPVVETGIINDLNLTWAVCSGTIIADSGLSILEKGLCWSQDPNPSLANNIDYTVNGGGLGNFIDTISELTEGTQYYITAYATNEIGTAYGIVKPFTTLIDYCEGISIVNYGGQAYHTVSIGQQCWFKENLNIGTRIDGSQEQTNNSIIEKYCHNDNEVNCEEYGGLYQWNEMMQYVTQQGTQGICPQGWHIPAESEWDYLISCLGGEDVAGGKLKEAGFEHWNSPNTGATNESGFTALPGGFRYVTGNFDHLGYHGFFWSSSAYDDLYAWERKLSYNSDNVSRHISSKGVGFSVRCLRDE